MMMSRRYPFTACQWQELEHQALVFKYMVSGIPIPPDLIFTLQSTMPNPGWNLVSSGIGSSSSNRKIDPEPGRCRRTDGKKWRCSKDAHHDSKYCDRHMHRGRNRSRKPLDFDININTAINTQPPPTPPTQFLYTYNHSPTTGIDDVASSHLTMGNDSLQAQPNKVAVTTHRFLEEWAQPKHRSSDSDETRLSMTPATANPFHDFFVTHKW